MIDGRNDAISDDGLGVRPEAAPTQPSRAPRPAPRLAPSEVRR
jgi:hypothetical protein